MNFDRVQVFKNRVVMDREVYDLLLYRAGLQKRMIKQLRDRLDEWDELLRTALHELALAEEKEPQLFTRRWIHNHRRDPDPIPLTVISNEGGEARAERS